jgi:hypothetical protein
MECQEGETDRIEKEGKVAEWQEGNADVDDDDCQSEKEIGICRDHQRIGNENENDPQMDRPWTFGRRREHVSLLGCDPKVSNVFVLAINVGMKMIN